MRLNNLSARPINIPIRKGMKAITGFFLYDFQLPGPITRFVITDYNGYDPEVTYCEKYCAAFNSYGIDYLSDLLKQEQ
jgi:hypothetical protein